MSYTNLAHHELASILITIIVIIIITITVITTIITVINLFVHACVQVMASSLSVVQLSSVKPAPGPPTQWSRDRLLDVLCDSLEGCLTYPMSHDLMLALLLSAVSAGVPVTAPTQTSDTAARNQVCLLFLAAVSLSLHRVC